MIKERTHRGKPSYVKSRPHLRSMLRFGCGFMVSFINIKATAELLTISQSLAAMNKPPKHDYASVKNYFLDEVPLDAEDEYYIYHKEDIVTLKPGRENAWLDGIVERVLQKLNCCLIRVSL